MTALISRLSAGVPGHAIVAVAGLAIGGLLVWPVVSGFLPRSPTGELALYSCPGDGSRVGVIRSGDQVLVTGRTADGEWVEVQYAGPGLAHAYARADGLTISGDVATLPVADCLAPAAGGSPNPSLTAILIDVPPTNAPPSLEVTPTPTAPPVSSSPPPTRTPGPTRTPKPTAGPTAPPKRSTPVPPTKKPPPPPTAVPTATATAAPPPPVAAFTSGQLQQSSYYTIRVTDGSSGAITSWAWDFDNDGVVDRADQQPANWRYTTSGSKTVKLTVTGPGGSDSQTKTFNVPQPEMGTSSVSDTNVYVSGECTDETTISVSAWPGVDTVTLTMIRPDFSSDTYALSYSLVKRRWQRTFDYHQLGHNEGKLFYWINAVDGTFRDREPEHGTSEFNLLENCVG